MSNGASVAELYGCMPVDDLTETEAWFKARESEGYEFMKCVLVNMGRARDLVAWRSWEMELGM